MPVLQISTPSAGLDDTALERLHRRLRIQLEDAAVGEVRAVRADEAEDGARSAGPVLIGVLSVLISSGLKEVAVRLGPAISAFVRKNATPVKIKLGDDELTIDRPTAEQSEQLIALFLQAHADRVGAAGEADAE